MDALPSPPAPTRLLPDGFRFGVSDSGFQSEGGYNGPGEPANNWAAWEESGRAERAGNANEFWDRYVEHFDAAVEAGCDSYRMSIEWARCEPERGVYDHDALEHYATIVRACRERGLEPVIALQHFTYPAWLGADFWLEDSAPERFAAWAEVAVTQLAPYCSRWITINEINANAIGSYLIGYFPPGGRFRRAAMVRAVDHMLTAHVLAYEVIHRIQPDAQVGTSTYSFWSYDADRILVDVLRGRSCGASRTDLPRWIDQRRRRYHDQILADVAGGERWRDTAVNVGLQHYLRLDRALPRTISAVYHSPHERCTDVTQVNYYDPRLSRYPRRPGRRAAGLRLWGPDPRHWEQTPSPQHLATYLAANDDGQGEEIWILENGMCNPVIDGEVHGRPDGWDRPSYLKAHLAAVVDAIDAGVNVTSYFNWALFDNYQWGEFESRFGLYGVKRDSGCKFLDVDAMGHDSAGAYRTLTDGLRRGDRSVLA